MAKGALSRVAPAALLAAAAVTAEAATQTSTRRLAALDVLVAVAFALGAAAAVPASRSVAALAYAVSATWVLGTLAGVGALSSYPTNVAVLLHRAPLAMLILAYPGRRMRNVVTRGLAVVAMLAPFMPGDGGPSATAAVACLVSLATMTRAARAAPALRPPQVTAAVVGAAVAAAEILGAAEVGSAAELLATYDIVLLGAAVTLLTPLASGRWNAAATSGLVVELGTAPAGAPVTARLSEVLHDPGLELRLRLPGGFWADEAGGPAPEPAVRDGHRSITRRLLDDGTEVALLHDSAAIPDRAVAESAVAVAATAIDNARRDREVHTRIEGLRRLRRGLLAAADEERRQLEVELRSGPLREIQELDHLLRDLPDEHAEALRSELAITRRELDEIARGLYPQALTERGLAGALSEAAARSPVLVTVASTLGDATIRPPVALTAYYVASEALANVAKHAHARHARITISANAWTLSVQVADDGLGGADPSGEGLRGLRDRVQAVDGELRVTSPRGVGTVVEALLPLSGA